MGRKPDGSYDRRHVRGKTQQEVTDKVRALEAERESGRYAAVHKIYTLQQWLEHWLPRHDMREKSRAAYSTAVYRHLIPGLGKHPLKELTKATIEEFYRSMYDTFVERDGVTRRKYRPGTVHQVHRTLRVALAVAVEQRYLAFNPASKARIPQDQSIEADTLEIEPFSDVEARSILAAALRRRGGIRFIIALVCGLRQGECLGLKWGVHVDLTGRLGRVKVRGQLQRHTWKHGCEEPNPDPEHAYVCGRKRACDCPNGVGGGLKNTTVKSGAGRRTLLLDAVTTEALRAHKAEQAAERLVAGDLWEDHGYVFTQPNGKPIDPRKDYDDWRSLLREAGVRRARLHDARHTAATVLLLQQVDSRTVMELMGWSSLAMLKNYQHVLDELRADAANRAGAWFYGETLGHGETSAVAD